MPRLPGDERAPRPAQGGARPGDQQRNPDRQNGSRVSLHPLHPSADTIDARQQRPNTSRLGYPAIPQLGALKLQALLLQRQFMEAAVHDG